MKYQYCISHVPGKSLVIADALSCAPSTNSNLDDSHFRTEVDAYVNAIMNALPATDMMLDKIRGEQRCDQTCMLLTKYCQERWPNQNTLSSDLKSYHLVFTELSLQDGLLMQNSQLVIPRSLQPEILQKLHSGHQGISKCHERARHLVWWPGISKDLEAEVKRCVSCCKAQVQCAESLIPTEFPQLSWQQIGTDLLEYYGSKYVLVVDHFSCYIKLAKLSSTDANTVINHLKSIFARHRIL